jgi:hypothetical protein
MRIISEACSRVIGSPAWRTLRSKRRRISRATA